MTNPSEACTACCYVLPALKINSPAYLQGRVSVKGQQVQPVTDTDTAKPVPSSARTILTLKTAMSLYQLTESESFWEVKQDTRCLVSWGSDHVVVAFRGTASVKNALADLQVRPFGVQCQSLFHLMHVVGFSLHIPLCQAKTSELSRDVLRGAPASTS